MGSILKNRCNNYLRNHSTRKTKTMDSHDNHIKTQYELTVLILFQIQKAFLTKLLFQNIITESKNNI